MNELDLPGVLVVRSRRTQVDRESRPAENLPIGCIDPNTFEVSMFVFHASTHGTCEGHAKRESYFL
jgi:hypothetical protein